MFTRHRVLAAATVLSMLAGPVAGAIAAPTPSRHAAVRAAGWFTGHGSRMNNGYAYGGNAFRPGGMAGINLGAGGSLLGIGANAGLGAGLGAGLR